VPTALTLFEKIWNEHVVLTPSADESLIYVDRNFVHEESVQAFEALAQAGRRMFRPDKHVAFADHYAPTRGRHADVARIAEPEVRDMLTQLAANAERQGLRHFGVADPRQGIMHVAGPELGFVLPGFVVTGSDSHTCTNGAFGAFAFGIGQSELKQVFFTQTLWRKKPRGMRITVTGQTAHGVSAKDVVLAVIASVGANGARGCVIEYAGSCIAGMTMEQRMTVCNMSVEAGAQAGMVAPDDTTFSYLASTVFAPKGAAWEAAVSRWRDLSADPGAVYDREVDVDARALAPMVTWGTSLDDVSPVGGRVPDPADADEPEQRARMQRALDYMGLAPGTELAGIGIDLVFIGSCSNARIEDLRAAAAVVKGNRTVVPSVVSPGSTGVKRQAEAEGLHAVFMDAGFEWRDSGCSMCVGSNGDTVGSRQRCASTSPRNFEGRQGVGARTHVMSPAMAAAAAITGRIVDVRTLIN
jgi:3-isopropylmalate/(R)-2-methylmalate dehydratase large subunit